MPPAKPGAVIIIFGAAVLAGRLAQHGTAPARAGGLRLRPRPGRCDLRADRRRSGPPRAVRSVGDGPTTVRERGVPAENILLEETSTSTLTSTRAVLQVLRAHGRHLKPVYAASSAYHLLRCVVLMRLAGLDAWACPARRGPASRHFGKRWVLAAARSGGAAGG